MSKLEWALYHAEQGFYVFRVKEDAKTPRYKGWQKEATRDPAKIKNMWSDEKEDYNIGASTDKFKSGALIVVDVDLKNGKDGYKTLKKVDPEGDKFPATRGNKTATGGLHLIFSSKEAVPQGANVFGEGLDLRSLGGYIVMAGSTTDDGEYILGDDIDVEPVPEWMFEELKHARKGKALTKHVAVDKIDPVRARNRAEIYLETAPCPEAGERNVTAFKVICEVKDYGLDQVVCEELIVEWNSLLEDPLDEKELMTTIHSAYKTGQNAIGARAVEAVFEAVQEDDEAPEEVLHPIEQLNKEYALVLAGGGHHILWETKDENGNFKLEHLNEASFHKYRAHKVMEVSNQKGTKFEAITKLWMTNRKARRYDGIVFAPEQQIDERFYNLWRGFKYEPIRDGEHIPHNWQRAVEDWIEHVTLNVCNGDKDLARWHIGWLAHIIQKPWEKPLTALVYKGRKGVGKNAAIERVCELISPYYFITEDRRYLTSNFNGHFENCLLAVFDEAVWAGDKEGEGKLKGLITGKHHNIEHKGKETYQTANLTRPVIIGNEGWLVPASHDERRYAVFNIGDGRRNDRKFFASMREDMEDGGYRVLLRFLMEFDLTGIDVNAAPSTVGLLEQKHASLEPLEQWWFSSIYEGELLGSAMSCTDFSRVSCVQVKNALAQYIRSRNIRSRIPDERQTGLIFANIAPSFIKQRIKSGREYEHFYTCEGGLGQLRKNWEDFIGSKVEWPTIENGDLECLM